MLPDILTSNLLSQNTSSEASFSAVQSWLQKCISRHDKCNRTITESLLPPRVLGVGLFDAERSVRLIETIEGQKGTYICLNHCWGTSTKPIQTTTANIEAQKQGIAWSKLPRTFQNAVDFVRRLGQTYICIDSLCILQDDKKDWLKHATSMASIYQHSYLTLAATQAIDSTVGCYSTMDVYEPAHFSAKNVHGQSCSIYYRKVLPHWWDPPSHSKKKNSVMGLFDDDLSLLDRAWVFQERFLSPRVLHFDPAELLLDITYSSDLSPALLGFMEPMLEGSPCRIIAGSWEISLFLDMLWIASSRDGSPKVRPSNVISPTWS